jgi:serine/threonine protein phosphatase PrpC
MKRIDFFGLSKKGKRDRNEDAMLTEKFGTGCIFAVADGLGGHAGGEVASRMAVDALRDLLNTRDIYQSAPAFLRHAFKSANTRIREFNLAHRMNSGTTLVAAIINENGRCTIGNIGDSRTFILDAHASWHTKDHSYVQQLVDAGELTEEEALGHPMKHLVERALGLTDDPEMDLYECSCTGKTLLLSSDGLHDTLRTERIRSIALSDTPRTAARCLLKEALRAGSSDNITIMIVKVGKQ